LLLPVAAGEDGIGAVVVEPVVLELHQDFL
jgi:hypothetical protein